MAETATRSKNTHNISIINRTNCWLALGKVVNDAHFDGKCVFAPAGHANDARLAKFQLVRKGDGGRRRKVLFHH